MSAVWNHESYNTILDATNVVLYTLQSVKETDAARCVCCLRAGLSYYVKEQLQPSLHYTGNSYPRTPDHVFDSQVI